MTASPSISCRIYRSTRQPEMYIYLRADLRLDSLPEPLAQRSGKLIEVMTLELHAERRLARVDVQQVMSALQARGYFVQLPPDGLMHANLDDGD
jgi:uncharacterized protein YcgL (UPF0745 family)